MSIFKGFRRGNGKEKVDPTPVALPAHFKREGLTMEERVRRIVEFSLSQQAADNGLETFEESMDFDIPDDDTFDPTTPWEQDHIYASVQSVERGTTRPPEPVSQARQDELRDKYFRKKSKEPLQMELEDAIKSKEGRQKPSEEA